MTHEPARRSTLQTLASRRRPIILISFAVFLLGAALFVFTQIMWIQIIGLVIGIPAFLVFVVFTMLYEILFAARFTSARSKENPDDFSRNNGRYLS